MRWGASEILPWLWLFLPATWLVFRLVKRKEVLLLRLIKTEALPFMTPNRSSARIRQRHSLWLSGILFCILALARPQWGFHWEEVTPRGLDIMVILDTSRSMLTEDIKPNRMQRAKWGISDLVKTLRTDRVGLVSFAGQAFLQCPMTSDYAAFLMNLDDVYVGIIPKGGTAIAKALETAADSFEAKSDADRVIVLVTDGEDHAGHLESVLERLQEERIKVYAVGVGTLEGELVPQPTESGESTYFKNREGNVVKSVLKENELERLAIATGGIYVRSTPGDFGLDRIVERGLSQLHRAEHQSKMVKAYEERFAWFLGLGLFLLLLEAIWRVTTPPRKEVEP